MTGTSFLLGIGCQKGGTTWLHSYLRSHPQVEMQKKELHIFDVLYIECCRSGLTGTIAAAQALLAQDVKQWGDGEAFRRLEFYANPASYFEWFARLSDRTGAHLVGEITPSYAGLPTEAFAAIREGLESRGLAPKVVFILRDPVERIRSAIDMRKQYGLNAAADARGSFSEIYKSDAFAVRSRYDLTLAALDRAFEREQVSLTFYEELFFKEQDLPRLVDWLQLDAHRGNLATRVRASQRPEPLSEMNSVGIVEHFAMVYRACTERFGASKLRALWPSYAIYESLTSSSIDAT